MSSKKKNDLSSQEIQAQLQRKNVDMNQNQRNGNYVQAQNCRVAIQQLKKDYQTRKLFELDQKQKQQISNVAKVHQEELENFNKYYDKKIQDYSNDGQKMELQMKKKHEEEEKETRQKLDKELPIKLKQSSELLNLRKMEQHMAKQKKCNQMVKEQTNIWMNARNQKIQVAINKLYQKQEHEVEVLQKKIKTGLQEQIKQRKKQQERLRLKYINICKQLKMQHDKQIINNKGQFKSKGGQNSPTKSRTFIK